MELRQVALEVARILQDAGKHALNDQMNPRDLKSFEMTDNHLSFTSDIDKRLAQFISNRITYVDVFDGFWQFRPEECHPGERYWCVGGIDGAINFVRSMPYIHGCGLRRLLRRLVGLPLAAAPADAEHLIGCLRKIVFLAHLQHVPLMIDLTPIYSGS